MAEMMPTKRFGAEEAKDITKKATTNSFQPKNFEINAKELTIHRLESVNKKQEKRKMKI